jgi:hypothetical protein
LDFNATPPPLFLHWYRIYTADSSAFAPRLFEQPKPIQSQFKYKALQYSDTICELPTAPSFLKAFKKIQTGFFLSCDRKGLFAKIKDR